MSLTIYIPEEQTAALAAKAKARGLSPEQYARELIQRDLAPDWLQESWSSSQAASLDQLSMDEIEAEIAAARKDRREPRLRSGS